MQAIDAAMPRNAREESTDVVLVKAELRLFVRMAMAGTAVEEIRRRMREHVIKFMYGDDGV